jgi:hypothetical protein
MAYYAVPMSGSAISAFRHRRDSWAQWTTLNELTKLDDDTFEQKLRDGSINPGNAAQRRSAREPYPQLLPAA